MIFWPKLAAILDVEPFDEEHTILNSLIVFANLKYLYIAEHFIHLW